MAGNKISFLSLVLITGGLGAVLLLSKQAKADTPASGKFVENVTDNGDGTLTFEFSDGTTLTTSSLEGPSGTRGTIWTSSTDPPATLGNEISFDKHLEIDTGDVYEFI